MVAVVVPLCLLQAVAAVEIAQTLPASPQCRRPLRTKLRLVSVSMGGGGWWQAALSTNKSAHLTPTYLPTDLPASHPHPCPHRPHTRPLTPPLLLPVVQVKAHLPVHPPPPPSAHPLSLLNINTNCMASPYNRYSCCCCYWIDSVALEEPLKCCKWLPPCMCMQLSDTKVYPGTGTYLNTSSHFK